MLLLALVSFLPVLVSFLPVLVSFLLVRVSSLVLVLLRVLVQAVCLRAMFPMVEQRCLPILRHPLRRQSIPMVHLTVLPPLRGSWSSPNRENHAWNN